MFLLAAGRITSLPSSPEVHPNLKPFIATTPKMPPNGGVLSSFKENHPKFHNFLYQFLLVIIPFESAIAIARYAPGPDLTEPNVVPRSLFLRIPLGSGNSMTPHICAHRAREYYVDLGPLTVLILYFPSTNSEHANNKQRP